MPLEDVWSLDDERLMPFQDLRHRNWTELSGLFIAEGPLLVDRLLSSDYQVHSILVDRKYLDHFIPGICDSCRVLVVDHELVEKIVGFNFHRGILGCGIRKPQQTIDIELMSRDVNPSTTMLGMVGIQDPENVGGILRICAGLGIKHVIIGPGTADPLSRRVLRVSMGNALRLNLLRSRNILGDLQLLKERLQVESVSASLAEGSQQLETCCRRGPLIVLVGNEKEGLPLPIQEASDHVVRIDMALGTDSLNVTIATGIIAHYFCRLAPLEAL